MEFYEIIIEPLSAFGTPLKGDTLFGQFCWQASYQTELLSSKFEDVIAEYAKKPFIVFSSAFPVFTDPEKVYLLKRPDIPAYMIFQRKSMCRREFREKARKNGRKNWIPVKQDLTVDLKKIDDDPYDDLFRQADQARNSINRITGATGKDHFAPYMTHIRFYRPGIRLVIFALIDTAQTDIERVGRGLEGIGKYGFGKDASTGMGRFRILEKNKLRRHDNKNVKAIYTLAPCVPAGSFFSKEYFKLFVRFGKHGDRLAVSRNPFKKPVMMADEGAVCQLGEDQSVLDQPYIGKAVTHISVAEEKTVAQGYAPYLPVKNWE